ncbi:MAG: hypothetical protein AAGM67_02810, partial [Bacteroidota bacterium]
SPKEPTTNTPDPSLVASAASEPADIVFKSPAAVLGNPGESNPPPAEEPEIDYMSMPDYTNATLKYKLGLIGSDAYSPKDKQALQTHILQSLGNKNLPVEAVYLESGDQQSSKSYPLRLYLLRLEQNPAIRIRSLEEVRDGGSVTGLRINES